MTLLIVLSLFSLHLFLLRVLNTHDCLLLSLLSEPYSLNLLSLCQTPGCPFETLVVTEKKTRLIEDPLWHILNVCKCKTNHIHHDVETHFSFTSPLKSVTPLFFSVLFPSTLPFFEVQIVLKKNNWRPRLIGRGNKRVPCIVRIN